MAGDVQRDKAHQQWNSLKDAVYTIDPVKGLPDMVFVCNAGLAYDNKIYLSRFRHKERSGEQEHYRRWFKEHGFDVLGDSYPEYFEGGGDACFSTYETLWAGYGHRSGKSAYEHVQKLGNFETVLLELTHPRFYHLDTCFAPVDETTALWYPAALSENARREITKRMPDVISISDAEADAFVCNAITIRKMVLSPKGVSAETKHRLSKRGFGVMEFDMSEFMKSGGACQCLILKL
ncbi:unnamed protein product [Gongylonema pulchrum]|uniref:Amidinotransferase n=1 Tax=Gongylonema pulchrum TaxID=637853 RepID=A0A183EF64_9BILA|nr:unnamed protein product [Gongylonema pulchrum]